MARPKVFISSTCYDLATVRSEVRPFVEALGYEPVMSDYSDILFDPREHTHDSCVKEIGAADLVVLIVGSRFGGKSVPTAQALINFDKISSESSREKIKDFKENLSITQIEILKAIQDNIPVYTFVQSDVHRDHLIYEKNKHDEQIISRITFPSLQKNDTASYIFEFINFIGHRTSNNSVFSFSTIDDIRSQLKSQWAHLFQRLLQENVSRDRQVRQYRAFGEQIEDLKAVILATVGTPQLRDTAKGVLRFRNMIDFLSSLKFSDKRDTILSDLSWEEILEKAGIKETTYVADREFDRTGRPCLYLIKADRSFYRVRGTPRTLDRFQDDWAEFKHLDDQARAAVFEAVAEAHESRPPMFLVRHFEENWDAWISGVLSAESESAKALDDDIPF